MLMLLSCCCCFKFAYVPLSILEREPKRDALTPAHENLEWRGQFFLPLFSRFAFRQTLSKLKISPDLQMFVFSVSCVETGCKLWTDQCAECSQCCVSHDSANPRIRDSAPVRKYASSRVRVHWPLSVEFNSR